METSLTYRDKVEALLNYFREPIKDFGKRLYREVESQKKQSFSYSTIYQWLTEKHKPGSLAQNCIDKLIRKEGLDDPINKLKHFLVVSDRFDYRE